MIASESFVQMRSDIILLFPAKIACTKSDVYKIPAVSWKRRRFSIGLLTECCCHISEENPFEWMPHFILRPIFPFSRPPPAGESSTSMMQYN